MMVAMASWAREEVSVTLDIDRTALGLESGSLNVARINIDPAGKRADDSFELNFEKVDNITLSIKPADGAIVVIKCEE
mgnify:CR=1 FL=1